MTTIFSFILVAIGLLVVINAIRAPGARRQEFPRHHAPVHPNRRFLSMLLGVIIALCGGGIFVISRLA